MPPYIVTALEVLTPEIKERVKKMYRSVDRDSVDCMSKTKGFKIVENYYAYDRKLVF